MDYTCITVPLREDTVYLPYTLVFGSPVVTVVGVGSYRVDLPPLSSVSDVLKRTIILQVDGKGIVRIPGPSILKMYGLHTPTPAEIPDDGAIPVGPENCRLVMDDTDWPFTIANKIPGNRMAFMRKEFARLAGVDLLPDPAVLQEFHKAILKNIRPCYVYYVFGLDDIPNMYKVLYQKAP